MGEYDAASIVGRMAGLNGATGNRTQKVTPDQLVVGSAEQAPLVLWLTPA